MPSPIEKEIVLQRFDGTNLLVDQAYLGPSYLRACQNWIPGETYRLTKTPGNTPYAGGSIVGVKVVRKIARVYLGVNRYLYAVITPSSGGADQLWVSANDGAWSRVQLTGGGDANFTIVQGTYDMEEMNAVLYVGNGVDPIYSIPIGGTATALSPIVAFTDGSAAPTATADGGSQILTGTYAYAWAIFDVAASRWTERGQTRTFTVNTTGDRALTFPTPTGFASNGGVLSALFTAHLFVSPVNLPVEFGHDQNPEGASAAGTLVLRVLTAEGPPLPLRGVARVGRIFRAHRGRLWIAGDQGATTAVWATAPVVPGLEQEVFNAGVFFPYNARTPRLYEDVTAIGLAATGRDDPDAPMIICGLTSTWLFYGDILDDPSAYFIQVSRTIGCIERETMVETPIGTFFVGRESVYMIPPGGGAPVDVGWPIRPAIAAIPPNQRAQCRAIYHKGFYKLAIVIPGQFRATQQWWLDIRQGVGQVPSWWGPSPRLPIAAWAVGQKDAAEPDRGFVAYDIDISPGSGAVWDVSAWDVSQWDSTGGPGTFEVLHQQNTFSEMGGSVKIISTLQTGDLTDGRPFDRKRITRVRVTAFPGAATSLSVSVAVDGGTAGVWDAMELPAPQGAIWDASAWDVAQWGQNTTSEGESIAPATPARPRGRSVSVQLTHTDAKALALRELEIRYLPVPRPIRVIANDPNS